jgi:hypothetical protein
VVALACVLAYTGYQSYECYLSYTNPDWYSSPPLWLTVVFALIALFFTSLRSFGLVGLSLRAGSAGRPG